MYLLLFIAMIAGGNPNNCELCHSDIKVEYSKSVHAREDITCVGCHEGDATSRNARAAHTNGFKSLKDRKDIPVECATCHSSSEKMKIYGLPTDQFALYQTSIHGKKLAEGDEHVAVCTDCHGVHTILPPTDPESQTHPRNIPSTCGACHSDGTLMSAYKISATPVADYESSVHGKALRQGNLQAPVCTSCHGTHGAAPPGIGDVAIVCGHCHGSERENFRTSPHKSAMDQSGIPECAGCHSNHKIQKTSYAMWTTTCDECHQAGSSQIKRGRQIQQYLQEADAEIEKADLSIQEAAKIPLEVSDYQARLEEARTYQVQVLPVTHSVNPAEVEELTRRSKSIAVEIQSEIREKQKIFKMRRIVLVLVWFYILLTIAIIYKFRKHLESKS